MGAPPSWITNTMLDRRGRIAICVAMIMSVALIATVVQHSESGIVLESDDVDEAANKLAGDLLNPEQIHEKAKAELSKEDKIVQSLVRLRAFCLGAKDAAKEFLENNGKSAESAFPNFIVAFGQPWVAPKPKPVIKDGIAYPPKDFHPKYNVIVAYSKAMGIARGKFGKGINKYVLDSIDSAVYDGKDVITGFINAHYKNPERVGLDNTMAGLTSRPNYMAKLSTPLEVFDDHYAKETKLADDADVKRAIGLLKSGSKMAYHSFLAEARRAEGLRHAEHHAAKVARSKAAIKAKAANPTTDDNFEYVKELSPAGAKANEDVEDIGDKTNAELHKDAQEAAKKWVENRLKHRKDALLKEQIARVEADAAKKAEAVKIAAQVKAADDKKAAAEAEAAKAAADIKAAKDAEAKAAADKKAAAEAAQAKAIADEKAKADAQFKAAREAEAKAEKDAEAAQLAKFIAMKTSMLSDMKCSDLLGSCKCNGVVMFGGLTDEGEENFSTKKVDGAIECKTGNFPALAKTSKKACYCRG